MNRRKQERMAGAALKLALCAPVLALGLGVAGAANSASPAQAAATQAASQPYVRPDVRRFLDAMAARPMPLFTAEVLARIRTLPPSAMAGPDLPVGDLAVVKDHSFEVDGRKIALRLFDARKERAPGPVVVFYHGGGFVVGSIDTHAGLAAQMARTLDLPVVSVEYRLAPEHPWPAAPDDSEAAARWIAKNGAALERKFTGLVLAGDSAGGNLTIITALALRDKPAALPVIVQMPIYPVTDMSKPYPSGAQFADGYGLSSANMGLYAKHYAADPQSWRHSPLLADQAGLPPTLVVTAGLDPLRDQGRAYAEKTIAAGVPTTYLEVGGTIHGFATYRRGIPSAQADLARVLDTAKQMIAQASAAQTEATKR